MTTVATSNVLVQVVTSVFVSISGATVYVNSLAAGQTGADGSVTIAVPLNRTSRVQVKAAGYQDYDSVFVNGSSTSEFNRILATLSVSEPNPSSITLQMQTPGATYSINEVVGASGVLDSAGVAQIDVEFVPGTYSITWSLTGATPRTDALVVVTGQTVYTFPALGTTDAASGTTAGSSNPTAASSSNPSGAPLSAASQASLTKAAAVFATVARPKVEQEISWPQYNYGKYFTPTQAFMYIGDVFIDELNGFQYTLQGNKVPVFGYSSYLMDAVGTGKSLVQGQLTINFISEGYLYTVLNDFKARSKPQPAADEEAAVNLVEQYTLLVRSGAPSDPSGRVQLASVRQQLNKLLANNSNLPSVISNARKSALPVGINPTYSRTPFDIRFQFDGGGRMITRTIKRCVLTSNEMVLGDSDSVVCEGYSFLARAVV